MNLLARGGNPRLDIDRPSQIKIKDAVASAIKTEIERVIMRPARETAKPITQRKRVPTISMIRLRITFIYPGHILTKPIIDVIYAHNSKRSARTSALDFR